MEYERALCGKMCYLCLFISDSFLTSVPWSEVCTVVYWFPGPQPRVGSVWGCKNRPTLFPVVQGDYTRLFLFYILACFIVLFIRAPYYVLLVFVVFVVLVKLSLLAK